MGITSAIVLFAVVWFMTLFIVLPLRLETQGDAGEVQQPGREDETRAVGERAGGTRQLLAR